MSPIWAIKNLSPGQRLVLLAIAENCDRSLTATIGVKEIAFYTQLTPRSVSRHLADLKTKEMISIQHKTTQNGQKQRSEYCLLPLRKHMEQQTLPLNTCEADKSGILNTCEADKSGRARVRVEYTNSGSGSGSGDINNLIFSKSTSVINSSSEIISKSEKMDTVERKKEGHSRDQKRENLYAALKAFRANLNNRLGISLVFCDQACCSANQGHLTPSLERLWGDILRQHIMEYKINLPEMLRRLSVLGAYIGQRKPLQLRDRTMSFAEFLQSPHNHFSKWMMEALAENDFREKQREKQYEERRVSPREHNEEERRENMKILERLKQTLKIKSID